MQSPFPYTNYDQNKKLESKHKDILFQWIKTGDFVNFPPKKKRWGQLANCIGFMLPHPPPGPRAKERSLKERAVRSCEVSGFEIPNSMTFRSHLATNSHFAQNWERPTALTKLLSPSYFHKQNFQGMALCTHCKPAYQNAWCPHARRVRTWYEHQG